MYLNLLLDNLWLSCDHKHYLTFSNTRRRKSSGSWNAGILPATPRSADVNYRKTSANNNSDEERMQYARLLI